MNNYKKIIFLDIDGVLASLSYLYSGKGYIDPVKCKLLNTLEDIGVEIVISSSWGYDNGRTEKALRDCGLVLPIIGYTEHFYLDWLCRGNEIEKWIQNNLHSDYEYVILDDESDFLLGQKDHFIQVDMKTGLTKRHINKIRKLLIRDETQE